MAQEINNNIIDHGELPGWMPTPSPTRPLVELMNDEDEEEARAEQGRSSSKRQRVSKRFQLQQLHGIVPSCSNNAGTSSPQADEYGAAVCRLQLQPQSHDGHKHDQQIGSSTSTGSDGGRGGGVFLTWKDLWVTVKVVDGRDGGKEGRQRTILERVTGYAQPGEVLAIMGPSGCGKSTLLDALAGRLGPNMKNTGEILANGRKQALSYATNSAYVTQDDTLMATLTVREAVVYSAQLQLPESMSKREKLERADMVIREMGLQDAVNTRIGGWSKKGISGGQKRRVSICIEILTRPPLLFLDEPTSGLDSAASYHVMNRIIKLAQKDRRTVIASIHQPSSEVFELFHNLCLLSCGRLVYFGPTLAANKFFADCGYPCPSFRNPSDHFLRTINEDFYLEGQDDNESGRRSTGLRVTDDAIDLLVKSYESSETYQQVQHRVHSMSKQEGEMLGKKGNHSNFIAQTIVLTRRSFVNMNRDLGYYWTRLGVYITISLCLGTIFFHIGDSPSSIQSRASMLSFVASLLTFMSIGGFPSFVEDMKLFQRERLNGHYSVGAFVIANTLSSTPFLMINSLVPGAISYCLVGLQPGFGHFFYFVLLLFTAVQLVESLMMVIAAIVPDFLLGIIIGAGTQGIFMLAGGYYRLPNDLPKPLWRYPMYHISFHKYANQGLYKNEFQGLVFNTNQFGVPAIITGVELLRNVWQVETAYSKWWDIVILAGMSVAYRIMFYGIVKANEKLKLVIRSLRTIKGAHLRQKAEDSTISSTA